VFRRHVGLEDFGFSCVLLRLAALHDKWGPEIQTLTHWASRVELRTTASMKRMPWMPSSMVGKSRSSGWRLARDLGGDRAEGFAIQIRECLEIPFRVSRRNARGFERRGRKVVPAALQHVRRLIGN